MALTLNEWDKQKRKQKMKNRYRMPPNMLTSDEPALSKYPINEYPSSSLDLGGILSAPKSKRTMGRQGGTSRSQGHPPGGLTPRRPDPISVASVASTSAATKVPRRPTKVSVTATAPTSAATKSSVLVPTPKPKRPGIEKTRRVSAAPKRIMRAAQKPAPQQPRQQTRVVSDRALSANYTINQKKRK